MYMQYNSRKDFIAHSIIITRCTRNETNRLTDSVHGLQYTQQENYHIAGNFRWRKFSYELPILIFRSLNIRTAQHSDVEHIGIIVQGNIRIMLFNTK